MFSQAIPNRPGEIPLLHKVKSSKGMDVALTLLAALVLRLPGLGAGTERISFTTITIWMYKNMHAKTVGYYLMRFKVSLFDLPTFKKYLNLIFKKYFLKSKLLL